MLTSSAAQQRLWALGYMPKPTAEQVHLYKMLNWLGMLAIAVIGLGWLAALRRSVRRSGP